MKSKQRSFKGGYIFGRFENQPKDIVSEQGMPELAVIPLSQGFGSEAAPLVKKGDKVEAGQIIGRSDSVISSPVHASVSGVVEEIKSVSYFRRDTRMVYIRADKSKKDYRRLDGYAKDWRKLKVEDIERLLYSSGVSSLDREGIPTRFKSSIIAPNDVENIIVHGIGSEPYNISLDVLLSGKKLLNFIEGLRILNVLMPNAKMYLALNGRKIKLAEEICKITTKHAWLKVITLEPKYPQGYDEMLVPTILGKKFPFGYSAANIGVVVLNIQAVISVYEAVCEGKPLIERIIALCGPGLKEALHINTRVGTPLSDILDSRLRQGVKTRVVLNSLLTGEKLTDFFLPVDRTFSQIVALPDNDRREFLSFVRPGLRRQSYSRTFLSSLLPSFDKIADTNVHGEARPCISCNYCDEACPVQIMPHLLYKYVKSNLIDERLMNYQIFHCIECGLCSFVCPSKIPLARHMKEGKDKLVMQGCDKSQCILPYFDLKGIEEYRGAKEA
ncbi:MAG: hypothetical protein COV72_03630 [Candidatus Omnitrophica bacterium CG11_big_fil_rev_8_21_14_0_20_42_13]|uniref:4Fe-4S ferredoxin-type domain-containing protein n=1 Tax=Candidatus Ghiorseimicrobium undicola TaxID=1974746 RepID=A0A2H0LY83_9BACT|nr:MAG: hypothetical protein COV72_03630 [Candidatus Omnitrophica bacterium CG11_big_fil_rev_8_21_14_0_20_42_13]